MIDKVQLIKEEIERRIDLYSIVEKDDSTFARMGELSSLIDFIDSLPEEPVSKDLALEEEITRYYKSLGIIENVGETYEWDDMIANTILTARHFAEWQKQENEKLLKEDTWNYIEEHYPDITKEEKLRLYDISIKSRLAGANTIKQKMMKDAVETTIVDDWQYGKDPDHAIIPAIHQRIGGFTVGDKVKIIILKTEQQ